MNDDETIEIIERVKEFCGYRSDAALAKALGMSPQNLASKKKHNTAERVLISHAADKGANPEWVRTGKGEKKASDAYLRQIEGEEMSKELLTDLVYFQKRRISELEEKVAQLEGKTGERKSSDGT